MESILEAVNIRRTFGHGKRAVHALKGVNMEIPYNQLVALKGRSGSGKTTLMNLLGALDTPTEGEVHFKEQSLQKLSERQKVKLRRKEIGFVFQSFALVPLMTARENVELGCRIAGVPAKEWKERVEESLSLVGLSKRASHRPLELSGGEQQRVAIARAIAIRPSLILADEPTAELDSKMGLQVMKVFKDLVRQESITIVMTTHDPAIMEIADYVYALEDGQIAQEDSKLQSV